MYLTHDKDGSLVLAEVGRAVAVCWVCGMPAAAGVRGQCLPTCGGYVRPKRGPALPPDHLPMVPGYYTQRSAASDLRRGVLPGRWVTVRRDDTFLLGRHWCTCVRRAQGSSRLIRVRSGGLAEIVYPPSGFGPPEVIRESMGALSC